MESISELLFHSCVKRYDDGIPIVRLRRGYVPENWPYHCVSLAQIVDATNLFLNRALALERHVRWSDPVRQGGRHQERALRGQCRDSYLGPFASFYRHYRWFIINLLTTLDRYVRYSRYGLSTLASAAIELGAHAPVVTLRFASLLPTLGRLANIKEHKCAPSIIGNSLKGGAS
jgi:hypothetical protein